MPSITFPFLSSSESAVSKTGVSAGLTSNLQTTLSSTLGLTSLSSMSLGLQKKAGTARTFLKPPFSTAINTALENMYSFGMLPVPPQPIEEQEKMFNLLLGYYAGDHDAVAIAEKAKRGEISAFQAPPDLEKPAGITDMMKAVSTVAPMIGVDPKKVMETFAPALGVNPALINMAGPLMSMGANFI